MKDDDKDPRHKFLKNPGRGYVPTAIGGMAIGAALDGTPIFTWLQIPRMMRDPQVQFGLRVLSSPFAQLKVKIRADSHQVQTYVAETWKRFWKRWSPSILYRYWQWGYCPALVKYHYHRGRVRLDSCEPVEPMDAKVLEYQKGHVKEGHIAGFSLQGSGGAAQVLCPHAFWFSGHGEFYRHYDRPRLAGAFTPWLEKNGRNGALHIRRLAWWKNAFSGPTIRHPSGTITTMRADGSPGSTREAADIAREILERMESGSAACLPNDQHPAIPGEYEWKIEPGTVGPLPPGLSDYPKDLDNEISRGLGFPPEVVEAAEVGSGWSGRMVPAIAWLNSSDEIASLMIEAFQRHICDHLVALNFGQRWYEIEAVPLAETILGGSKPQPGPSAPGTAPQAGMMADLSWVPTRSQTGRLKAVGSGEDTGKTLYGAEAQAALNRQGGKERPEAPKSRLGRAAGAAKGRVDRAQVAVERGLDRVAERGRLGRIAAGATGGLIRGAKILEHALTKPMAATQAIAVEAAKERGLSEDGAVVLHRVLAVADFAGGYVSGYAGMMVGGAIGAKVATFMPTASVAYLAYSTARDPKATWKAAKRVVGEMIRGHHDEHPEVAPVVLSAVGENGGAEMARTLADRLKTLDPETADRYLACVYAALGYGQTLQKAVEMADRATGQGIEIA